jgi:hypothetical protein
MLMLFAVWRETAPGSMLSPAEPAGEKSVAEKAAPSPS